MGKGRFPLAHKTLLTKGPQRGPSQPTATPEVVVWGFGNRRFFIEKNFETPVQSISLEFRGSEKIWAAPYFCFLILYQLKQITCGCSLTWLGHEPSMALSLCSRIKKRKRRAYDPGSKHCTFFMLAHKEPALRKGMCPFELKTNPMQNSGGLGEGRTKNHPLVIDGGFGR